ncbi:MAG: SurA N-terminal domain-containing protein [Bacteroidales bacterium]|jgi:peptidyl-prolyl cis-trans isomerase D|nr:hypothetical protein [Bacteroidales bacterium]HQB20444.1 SurA N-terminal domain-containing protein [Bacteroidales bacterium]
MAVIGKIRKHSVLLLVVVAVALLAFILGDFIRPSNSGLKNFLKIGKYEISYFEYIEKYNYYSDLLRQNEAENIEYEANNYTFNEMVDSLILSKQTIPLGISVTPEELRDLMAGPNPHEYARRFFGGPEGKYDMQIAQGFLNNMDQYDSATKVAYLYYESIVEKETLHNKYMNLLAKAAYTPKYFARKMQEENEMKANLVVVAIPYSNELVTDDKISFSEKDIQKWYEENLYRFPQDQELRNIEYVIFDIKASEEDKIEIEREFREKYELFKESEYPQSVINSMIDSRYDSSFFKRGELHPYIDSNLFNAPIGTFIEPFIDGDTWMFAKLLDMESRADSLYVNFLFIAKEGMQNAPRKEEQSKLIVDSAFMALINGQNFYEVATHFSDIKPDPQNDSLSIWLVDGSDQIFFDRSTAQTLFDTLHNFNPGIMTKYESTLGTWIFIINHRSAIEKKIQVAIGKKIIEASSETTDNIESAANNFANGTDTYDKFDKKTKELNLNKRSFDRLTAMAYSIPGITSNAREIVRWAYDENTEKGNVSGVFHVNDMFVVVTLKSIYPKGNMDLEQVKSYVENMVKRDKKAEKLTALLEASLSKTKNLNAIASEYKTSVDTVNVNFSDRNFGHYGPEPKLIGKIFATDKKNQIELIKGDMGMYVVSINNMVTSSSLAVDEQQQQNIEMYQQQQSMMLQNRIQNTMQILRKMYEIKDNRHKVF